MTIAGSLGRKLVFKLQYRIYPYYIYRDGAIQYYAQYRYFPFWWNTVEDGIGRDIFGYSKEETLKKLNDHLKLDLILKKEQKNTKPL